MLIRIPAGRADLRYEHRELTRQHDDPFLTIPTGEKLYAGERKET